MSRLVGGLFIIKGLISVLISFQVWDDLYPAKMGANLWDFLLILLTEIGPTAVFLFLAKRNKKVDENNTNETTAGGTDDNEIELQTYDPPK